MNYTSFGCLVLACCILSCKAPTSDTYEIGLSTALTVDTLLVQELITGRGLSTLYKGKNRDKRRLVEPVIARIFLKEQPQPYLTFLEPGTAVTVSLDSVGKITTDRRVDSLLNDLWKSTTTFIAQQSSFLFSTQNNDSIVRVFENFRRQRAEMLVQFTGEVSPTALAMLQYQNDARIYAFLFFLGRISKGLAATDTYFDFSTQIPPPDTRLKYLPDIYLYRYEVAYLRQHDHLNDIPSFLRFIEQETKDSGLADFLKAMYLKALIENPTYWEKHQRLFNTEVLTKVLRDEEKNASADLFNEAAASFFATQEGNLAFNFTALNELGQEVRLTDFKGKVVFIDAWATWCGPCLAQRPRVIEMAKKFEDHEGLVFLFLSVDANEAAWSAYLEKHPSEVGQQLFIENGMRTEFGKHYNVNTIPRYILIGNDGRIIDANLPEPSATVTELIASALEHNDL